MCDAPSSCRVTQRLSSSVSAALVQRLLVIGSFHRSEGSAKLGVRTVREYAEWRHVRYVAVLQSSGEVATPQERCRCILGPLGSRIDTFSCSWSMTTYRVPPHLHVHISVCTAYLALLLFPLPLPCFLLLSSISRAFSRGSITSISDIFFFHSRSFPSVSRANVS